MSTITINDELLIDAKIAAFNGQTKPLSQETSVGSLADWWAKHPEEENGFPFSGDHLGTFSHRETTPYGDPGDEIRRERIYRA